MKKKFMKGNRGITLIAMIITIIVMLVLAGVSMNAIIGDNGILSNAINATTATSISVLQEYLQELYVENYDNDAITKASSAVVGLSNISAYSGYFYNPKRDSHVGGLSYVVDSEGHVLYLINKSELPEDIQKQLVGGDAGNGDYSDYANLNDVYGVTSDLDVYYCSNGLDTIQGITSSALDNDDPLRKIFDADSTWANLLSSSYKDSDGNVTAQSIRSVTSLTINSTVSSLVELYNFTSLKELTIDGATLSSLDGIQNVTSLNYLCFTNYGSSGSISDYSAIKYVTDLEYLYLTYSNDSQVNSVFTAMAGTDYSKLAYLGVYNGTTNVTTVDSISNLTTATQTAVNYLYLYNNKLTDISCVQNFSSVTVFYCYSNSIRTLTPACSNMSNLVYLYAYSNKLGADESEDAKNEETDALACLVGKAKLKYLEINSNSLIYTGYLSGFTSFNYLYLAGNTNLDTTDLTSIKSIYWASSNRSIDSKYTLYLSFDDQLFYSSSLGYDLEDSSTEINALVDNTDCIYLDLSGNSKLTDSRLQSVLATMKNLEYLRLSNVTLLSSVNFVQYMPNLKELYIDGTSVIDSDDVSSGLELLEIYCPKIYTLVLSTDVDLTKIVSTMNNMYTNYSTYYSSVYTLSSSYKGIVLTTQSLWQSLSKCSNLTTLFSIGVTNFTSSTTFEVDLTTTSLEVFYLKRANYICFKLPSSLTSFSWNIANGGIRVDGSLCTNITSLTISDNQVSTQKLFDVCVESFSTFPNLESLTVGGMYTGYFNLDAFSTYTFESLKALVICVGTTSSTTRLRISDVAGLSGLSGTLTSLTIGNTKSDCTGWECLNDLEKLTYLRVCNTTLSTLDFVTNMSALQTLIVTGCKISSCIPLLNNTSLTYINLKNNILYNTSSTTDSEGNPITYYNCQILANLNPSANNGGQLTALYLSGNEYLGDSDYAYVKAYTWSSGSDF